MFGLVGWTIERFVARRTRLHELQYAATRLRERPVAWSVLLVTSANVIVFWSLADAAASGRTQSRSVVMFAQAAIGISMIAFGGLNWALDGAAAPIGAVLRLEAGHGSGRRIAVGSSRTNRHARSRHPLPGISPLPMPVARQF